MDAGVQQKPSIVRINGIFETDNTALYILLLENGVLHSFSIYKINKIL